VTINQWSDMQPLISDKIRVKQMWIWGGGSVTPLTLSLDFQLAKCYLCFYLHFIFLILSYHWLMATYFITDWWLTIFLFICYIALHSLIATVSLIDGWLFFLSSTKVPTIISKKTCLQLPYNALLCLISLVRHNNASTILQKNWLWNS